ncbi:MAG: hypothetical protein WC310_03050 [Patescibacteria group bacterium]|jgi:hypothetical protein
MKKIDKEKIIFGVKLIILLLVVIFSLYKDITIVGLLVLAFSAYVILWQQEIATSFVAGILLLIVSQVITVFRSEVSARSLAGYGLVLILVSIFTWFFVYFKDKLRFILRRFIFSKTEPLVAEGIGNYKKAVARLKDSNKGTNMSFTKRIQQRWSLIIMLLLSIWKGSRFFVVKIAAMILLFLIILVMTSWSILNTFILLVMFIGILFNIDARPVFLLGIILLIGIPIFLILGKEGVSAVLAIYAYHALIIGFIWDLAGAIRIKYQGARPICARFE